MKKLIVYRKLCHVLFSSLIVFLTACTAPTSGEFNITSGFSGSQDAIVVNGHGWTPGITLQIWIYSEPIFINGEVASNPTPRLLGTVTADQYGLFGFGDPSTNGKFPINKTICGDPPHWVTPWFVARETNNAPHFPSYTSASVDYLWFTRIACR